jgi:hypothetical protein
MSGCYSYDMWKAHDPAWDEDGSDGPFCPDCGRVVGGPPSGYAVLCRTCVERHARHERSDDGE